MNKPIFTLRFTSDVRNRRTVEVYHDDHAVLFLPDSPTPTTLAPANLLQSLDVQRAMFQRGPGDSSGSENALA